jgi:hypothetical protein
VAVTGHHARLGTWPLARLYQGSHLRLLNFMRLQGATPTAPPSLPLALSFAGPLRPKKSGPDQRVPVISRAIMERLG